ncbi:acyl transferase/acyl hydrolase/lysophospholipase [Tribonema minus]|uniref:Acyl transferase/acyl hydrolase/lysophospholipase n=1 Tax=Tribonema minus TaxID=303371 RepID=A0A835ZEF1_9STRA|nr:acyl transferase/acyl hydrolase/lysophospholipase [Tribonema minus]
MPGSAGGSNRLGLRVNLDKRLSEYLRLLEQLADKALQLLSEKAPGIEAWLLEALETIFAPRLLLRHLVAAMALQAGLITWNMATAAYGHMMGRMNRKHRALKEAHAALRLAQNYEEWKQAAERLDELENHTEWRNRPDSLLYDHELLQSQIDELNAMMQRQDVFGLMFRLRGSLSRSQHGMLHEGLFSRAHAGTKILVENYHETVCKALRYICTSDGAGLDIPSDAKLAFFNETRHAYGRTALMLSGGAAMGFYHVGVVKALIERQLMPRVISGASAGSIVAAMVGTRTDAELRPMYHGEGINLGFFRPLRESRRRALSQGDKLKNEAFWQLLVPPALRWAGELFWQGVLSGEGLLRMDTDYFRAVMRHNVGGYTFQEAFDRTGRIMNIIVAPRNRTDPPRLLNYLTAPHVLVWSAAVCSSSVPGVFEPSTLLVKEADGSIRPEHSVPQKYVDGSMEADLPMQQISELFNINHFLVSQVNPHATVFSTMALSKSVWNHPVYSFLVGLVGFLKAQVRNWFRNVLEFVSLRRMAPIWATRRGGIQLLTQEYEGRDSDVTISPWEGHETLLSSFSKMLSNPSRREFANMVTVSERNTWPKVDMIRVHCAVEVALEQCVRAARRQVVAEAQAQAVRLAAAVGAAPGGAAIAASMRGGRVPSFYTSRSLVNMAGLGLGLPDPALTPTGGFRAGGGFAGAGTLGASFAHGSSGVHGGHGGGAREMVDEVSSADGDSDQEREDVGLSMEGNGTSMLSLNGADNGGGGEHAAAAEALGSGAAAGADGVGAEELSPRMFTDDEDDGVEANIVKSTSMSSFYYRRSRSFDANEALRPGRQNSASTGALQQDENAALSMMRSVTHAGTGLSSLDGRGARDGSSSGNGSDGGGDGDVQAA